MKSLYTAHRQFAFVSPFVRIHSSPVRAFFFILFSFSMLHGNQYFFSPPHVLLNYDLLLKRLNAPSFTVLESCNYCVVKYRVVYGM